MEYTFVQHFDEIKIYIKENICFKSFEKKNPLKS